ncbi:hypothetical protein [Bdellovibrio sp. HCB337]|uniref:hypothetical protein n=1 Tax=Bdellovibrio sp. HCB337 TaxID=3394358 RepID=UPI0039A76444
MTKALCALISVGLSCLLLVPPTFAAVRDIGNGGAGVLVNGEPVLFDLYEIGVEKPEIDEVVVPLPLYVERASRMDILTEREARLLAIKLTEIREVSPKFADYLVLALNQYIWRLVDQPLKPIEEETPVEIDAEVVQLANRLGTIIRIQSGYWGKMSEANKVALVLHEVIYGLAPATYMANGSGLQVQDGPKVRQIVGYIFLPELKKRGVDGFFSYTGISWELSRIVGEGVVEKVVSTLMVESTEVADSNFYRREVFMNGPVYANEDKKFCALVEKNLTSPSGRVQGHFFYLSHQAILRFEGFDSPSGRQQFLQEDSLHMVEDHITGSFLFSIDNINGCKEAVLQNVRAVFKEFGFDKVSVPGYKR